MTVIRPNSISGVTSITAHDQSIEFYKSDGTLSGGNLDGVNINTAGILTASNFKSGTSNVHSTGYECTNVNATGVITATSFSGSGANLTSIPAGQLTGTVADARISTLTASKLTGALPAISGANLTGITGTTINNNADNRVITGSGTANTLNGESLVTIDSSGRLSVAPNAGGSGITLASQGSTYGGTVTLRNTTGSNHDWMIAVGGGDNAYVNGRGLLIRDNTTGINHTQFRTNGDLAITDGNLVMASGHGIDFSAHGNAGGMTSELLDDYEEGSFTPTTSGISATHNPNGIYTKIGDMVFISIVFTRSGSANFTFSGGDSGVVITNLPFTCGNKAGVGQIVFPRLAYTGSSDGQGATVLVEPGQAKIYVSNAGFSSPRANLSVFYSIT